MANIFQGIGNAFTGNLDFSRQEELNNQQRIYETHMSNTAYQRASADMKAAGINPALLAGSAKAASTPSVSAGSAPRTNGLDALTKVLNSALALAKAGK